MLLNIQCLRWQSNSWWCGYIVLFIMAISSKRDYKSLENFLTDILSTRMPKNFPDLVLLLLRKEVRRKSVPFTSLTDDQLAKIETKSGIVQLIKEMDPNNEHDWKKKTRKNVRDINSENHIGGGSYAGRVASHNCERGEKHTHRRSSQSSCGSDVRGSSFVVRYVSCIG